MRLKAKPPLRIWPGRTAEGNDQNCPRYPILRNELDWFMLGAFGPITRARLRKCRRHFRLAACREQPFAPHPKYVLTTQLQLLSPTGCQGSDCIASVRIGRESRAGQFYLLLKCENSLCWLGVVLLIASLPVCAEAQTTWTWVGDESANILTNPANWSGTGPVDLNSTSTELIFGRFRVLQPDAVSCLRRLPIGTLTITNNTAGPIFSGQGTGGSITGGKINGLNVYTAIKFSPSGTSSTTNNNPIQTSGPIYLNGFQRHHWGHRGFPQHLGTWAQQHHHQQRQSNHQNGTFELELGGDASGLAPSI